MPIKLFYTREGDDKVRGLGTRVPTADARSKLKRFPNEIYVYDSEDYKIRFIRQSDPREVGADFNIQQANVRLADVMDAICVRLELKGEEPKDIWYDVE